jgi:phospholipid/cholesterol/gamma-HCH transport system permease protein
MPAAVVERVGRRALNTVEAFGAFWRFAGSILLWLYTGLGKKTLRLMPPLMYEIGVKSIPVVAVTGGFIGMVLAVEMYNQFKSIGQENRLGAIIGVSVVKQIGPVLAAVMLAGRVGGALTAELGTMNVTEQLDALRVMGADPIRHLAVPRFLACILLTPILTIFSDILGCFDHQFVMHRQDQLRVQPD